MKGIELTFYDYLRIARRRVKIIILCLIAVVAATVVYTNRQVLRYKASARVKIEASTTLESLLTGLFMYSPGDIMATEENMIKSRLVMEESARKLGMITEESTKEEIEKAVSTLRGRVSTERVKTANIIEISVISTDRFRAAEIANTVARVYREQSIIQTNKQVIETRKFIEEQLEVARNRLQKAEEALGSFNEARRAVPTRDYILSRLVDSEIELSKLEERYTDNYPKIKELKARVEHLRQAIDDYKLDEIELARLKREVTLASEAYTLLSKKYREALIAEAGRIEPVSIIDTAVVPFSPINPHRTTNIVLGVIMGLLVGFVFAFIAENIDTSMGTVEEIEELMDVPVLGVIPHIDIEKGAKEDEVAKLHSGLLTHFRPQSSFAEAYRIMETNIEFTRLEKGAKTIFFTSTSHREGKSTIAANYAISLAQAGKKTMLVESDLRRPIYHRLFGVKKEPGLTDVILQRASLEDVIRGVSDFVVGEWGIEFATQTPGLENLFLITSGQLSPNILGILASGEIGKLINELKEKFDVVIFDTPPILPLSDTPILGSRIDAAVMVYRAGVVPRRALRRARFQLELAGINILGVVLNDIKPYEMAPEAGYRYKYYGQEPEKKKRRFFGR
ncbi:MAG: polysaccharide biosynthesis tyrosine autokinase [candidate division WOR-3 bacterium]|nr:polysaccharide biosynthesis tyrosine autokinase [candidate division WOR-3 bacterium]